MTDYFELEDLSGNDINVGTLIDSDGNTLTAKYRI